MIHTINSRQNSILLRRIGANEVHFAISMIQEYICCLMLSQLIAQNSTICMTISWWWIIMTMSPRTLQNIWSFRLRVTDSLLSLFIVWLDFMPSMSMPLSFVMLIHHWWLGVLILCYIWVINNCIAYWGVTYVRGLMVSAFKVCKAAYHFIPSGAEAGLFRSNKLNIMAGDALAICATKPSASVILTVRAW